MGPEDSGYLLGKAHYVRIQGALVCKRTVTSLPVIHLASIYWLLRPNPSPQIFFKIPKSKTFHTKPRKLHTIIQFSFLYEDFKPGCGKPSIYPIGRIARKFILPIKPKQRNGLGAQF